MAIKTYIENERKLFEVYVNGFDARGRRIQQRKKGIETKRKAEMMEFELKRDLAKLREEAVPLHWSEWLYECIKRMKLVHRPSTVIAYETSLAKWINPHWDVIEMNKLTKQNVYDLIFKEVGDKVSPWTRKTILKKVRQIFEIAVEEGIIDRNPCAGTRVNVPEVDQKVLTKSEVEIFLKEARMTQHRFYPVWALALMTGMRSGDLFALLWNDIDFDGRTISVSR